MTRARSISVLALLFVASTASAQDPARLPVGVQVEGLFGEGTILPEGYAPILVTLTNRRGDDFHGTLELRAMGYNGPLAIHVAEVDLPARAERQLVLTAFVESETTVLDARYLVDERSIGGGNASPTYGAGARSVVVLGDPPRLRGALLDLDVEEMLPSGPRQVRAPLGAVRMDAASGDPMLPVDPQAWAQVKLLAASAPVLARASAPQRAAILDWIRAGGLLLVFPRTPNDLSDAWLRRIAGPVGVEPSSASPPLVPPSGERFALSCSEHQRVESFGCSRRVGLGRVFLASYDGTSPSAIESGVPRELVRAIYAQRADHDAIPFGLGRDDLTGYGSSGTFGALRAALDPNEGFRPALIFVALVLFLYVIAVGPLNFRWVQKKNRPALALVTTPLLALACLVVLLVAGYVGKGVSMRYRRIELVEMVEGQRRAPARRYTGLYSTRPGSFDLPSVPIAQATRRVGGAERGPTYRHEGGRLHLTGFHAGLWETVFLREDRFVDLGGAIRFERDGRRLAAVVNESRAALTNAFVIDSAGWVYRVGDVPAGGRAEISRTSVAGVGTGPGYCYYAEDPTLRALRDAVGVSREEDPYLRGLACLLPQGLSPINGEAPVLFARAELPSARIGGLFASEADYRWVRVFPALRGAPVEPAPAVSSTGVPPEPWAEPGVDSGAADAGAADAGTEVTP